MLQAVTQSVQPLAHLPLSISMPQRTLLLAPGLRQRQRRRLRDLDQPHAGRDHDAGQSGRGNTQEAAPAQLRAGNWLEWGFMSCVMA